MPVCRPLVTERFLNEVLLIAELHWELLFPLCLSPAAPFPSLLLSYCNNFTFSVTASSFIALSLSLSLSLSPLPVIFLCLRICSFSIFLSVLLHSVLRLFSPYEFCVSVFLQLHWPTGWVENIDFFFFLQEFTVYFVQSMCACICSVRQLAIH